MSDCLLYVLNVVKTVLNFDEIISKCGFETEAPQDVLKHLAALEEFYELDEIVEIYNYLLKNVKDFEILSGIVRLADSYKSESTLAILVDTLLGKVIGISDDDDCINYRVLCTKSISNYKDASSVGALLFCLNNKSENYKIRLACADALGRIGDRYAVAPLIDVVKDEEEKSVYVKESAAFALGLIGDKSAVEPLVSIMEAKQGFWDKFSFLKERIIEVLGKINIKNDRVLKVLKDSLMDASAMVRINAIEALMNSEYEEASSLIHSALHDTDEEVQRNALIALYNIQGRDVLDEVISLPGYSNCLKEEAKNILEEYEE